MFSLNQRSQTTSAEARTFRSTVMPCKRRFEFNFPQNELFRMFEERLLFFRPTRKLNQNHRYNVSERFNLKTNLQHTLKSRIRCSETFFLPQRTDDVFKILQHNQVNVFLSNAVRKLIKIVPLYKKMFCTFNNFSLKKC